VFEVDEAMGYRDVMGGVRSSTRTCKSACVGSYVPYQLVDEFDFSGFDAGIDEDAQE
jgi:hypothetical protein